MCSIIGYKGKSDAAPLLVDSLKRMEYRGYDSVGLATINEEHEVSFRKGVGKVAEVNQGLNLTSMKGHIGIGHTRWATHGAVTDHNAHPHSSCSKNIAVVHNGIIENYKELKEELIQKGHKFKSQTDSEVIAHLLEEYYKNNVKKAMVETCRRIQGAYAFVAAFEDGTVAGARNDEPLIVGVGKEGYFLSSDVLGFLQHTDKAIFLDNCDIAIIGGDKLEIYIADGKKIRRPVTQVAWELGAADKGKYAHYTLKEINEQKFTITNAANQDPTMMQIFCDVVSAAKNLYITGSGTSYNSALIAKHILTKFAKIRVETIMSSEFQYAPEILDEESALIAISQSGETADVLQSVKAAKAAKAKILSIVNVPTSSLARMSDSFLRINCGPEIGVAATKSFTGQLAVIYNVADRLCNGCIGIGEREVIVKTIEAVLAESDRIANVANDFQHVTDVYLLGRALHYPIALEGALKLKELSYVHAEGIAAGELKHGPLALMDKNTDVIILNPSDSTYNDTISNVHEIRARGAKVIGISDKYNEVYNNWIKIPKVNEALYPLIEVIPLQILAYHAALKRNADPDYPRNLAKSVTVK
ncbi:MAG: glucosamine--fructose-6-phosphate aminotransferase (isomerizing) [Candidatus Nitrosomirales archaeon]|jgi:glucosamine--fructose-6-phosphate aminotransferase (isomerizing)